MKTMNIAVACHDASSIPDMPVFSVTVTDRDCNFGIHYDKAKAMAEEAGYERPFVCFDAAEHNAILSAARSLDLVPRVVVVDFTDGLVHSVRCDAGDVKVIWYDESETEGVFDAIVEIPVGNDSETVRCRAHIQNADMDPTLKKLRD